MAQKDSFLIGLMLLVACSQQEVTSPAVEPDPDLTGRYRSTLGIVITDGSYFPGVRLNVDCPSEWVLSQIKPRGYAVSIEVLVDSCYDNWGHIAEFLNLAPAFTGVLHLDTVNWQNSNSESIGTILVGQGTAGEFESITGCSASEMSAGWRISFQAYTLAGHTFKDGWAYFFPVASEYGFFRVQCRGIGGLYMDLGFNGLRVM